MFINHITHSHSKNFTLDISNLAIDNNKIIGLVGENGAGKTTLMDLLSTMVLSNGIFDVDGHDPNSILYIPSDVTAYDFLTVKEFCDLVLKYSNSNQTSDSLMDKLGLLNQKNTLISALSQGMRKKLTLINIYINNYSLIILDEPFNSIDLKYIFQLKEIIRELKQTSTVLVSSHIVDTLIDICDEFIYIENGSVKSHFQNTGDKKSLEEVLFNGSITD